MKIIPATVALLFLPAPILAAVGGRCVEANGWGGDCICLDYKICREKWNGTPYTGHPGLWPCPFDPDNVMACVVKPCPGMSSSTQCLWRDACSSISRCMLLPVFFLIPFFFLSFSSYHAPCCASLWYTIICWHQVVTAPVCPGGNDFVCCNHHWTKWELGRKGESHDCCAFSS